MADSSKEKTLPDLGLFLPRILVPSEKVDKQKWSVLACDQHTSEPEYWDTVDRYVADAPSTLRCMLPECYLHRDDAEKRVASVRTAMDEYMDGGIFKELSEGIVLVERRTAYGRLRLGMIAALDLEKYDYSPGTKPLIRPTEGTIIERLPPRVRIRENAALEFPHVLVLIDDPDQTVIEPLFATFLKSPPLYRSDLMMGSGSVSGRFVAAETAESHLRKSLTALEEENRRQGVNFLFAVGDGNHSLATAKAVWERVKIALSGDGRRSHPARFALVEIVNLYDPGVSFEPIHRFISGIDVKAFLSGLSKEPRLSLSPIPALHELEKQVKSAEQKADRGFVFGIVIGTEGYLAKLEQPRHSTPTAAAQDILETFIASGGGSKSGREIDYIHGTDALFGLCRQEGTAGFLLPGMNKKELFKIVEKEGVLPRKAFSIGEASEKRFYYEGRRIGLPLKS